MSVPVFRQVSDMRKPFEIKAIVDSNRPVFVLKNKDICFIAISPSQFEEYESLKGRQDLHAKLAVAEAENAVNAPCIPHDEAISRIRKF